MKICKNIECNKSIKSNRTYCSLSCRNVYVNKYLRDYTKNGKAISEAKKIYNKEYNKNPKYCMFCDIKLTYKQRNNTYCSVKCSNLDRDPSIYEDIHKKSSSTIKELWKTGHYDETSAKNHLDLPTYFSSKNERKIYKYFKENFKQDDWRSGGRLKFKNYWISRDLYSPKMRICFEYDGIWHFEDIKGQLEYKQMKDRLLEEWCKLNNFRLIRVDELEYKDMDQIVELVYNTDEEIIKIGNRY